MLTDARHDGIERDAQPTLGFRPRQFEGAARLLGQPGIKTPDHEAFFQHQVGGIRAEGFGFAHQGFQPVAVGAQVQPRHLHFRQPVLAVKPHVGLVERIQHVVGQLGRLLEAHAHLLAQLADAAGQPARRPAALQRLARSLQDRVQRIFRHVRQQVRALALQHFPGHAELFGGGVVTVFLLLQVGARLFDQFAVLARQLDQLDQLVAAALEPRGQIHPALVEQGGHLAADRVIKHVAPRWNHLVRQQVFQRLDAGTHAQSGVAADAGRQRLLRRHREHPAARQLQHARGFLGLPLDAGLHLGIALQLVPQHVDLVQHRHVVIGMAMHVFLPDFHIRARHPGIGRQQIHHRMRIGNHRQREFRLGAQRVEPGRIEYRQPGLQQRMRVIDHGIAPGRHLHGAVGAQQVTFAGVFAVPQPEFDGIHRRHRFGLGEFFQAFLQLPRIARVEQHPAPLDRHVLQARQRFAAAARFDRQQAQAGHVIGAGEQLGRAHGGAPGVGRQQALTVVGEEQGVDEFGLAARKLGDEGHHQLVLAQAGRGIGQPQGALGIDAVLAVEPVGVVGDRRRQPQAPFAVLGDFLFQVDAHV